MSRTAFVIWIKNSPTYKLATNNFFFLVFPFSGYCLQRLIVWVEAFISMLAYKKKAYNHKEMYS